jgi:thiol-disulfide isomerase/thioredoxin
MHPIHTRFRGQLASCRIMLLLAAAAAAFSALPAHAENTVAITPGMSQTAAPVVYSDGKSNTYALNAQENKLTAVHFWATWCAPCVGELPEIDAAQNAYGGKGFKVLALSLDSNTSADKPAAFMAQHGITHLKPLIDFSQASFKAAHAPGLPTTVFIDTTGKEVGRAEGPVDWKSKETQAFIERYAH